MSDLERELERELHRVLDPISSRPIPARRAPASGGWAQRVAGGAGAALSVKVLTGIAVAAAAVTVAGAATTGSLDPGQWGQAVTNRVQDCKDTLRASGTRGIGQCVSEFAKTHGPEVASAARHHGNGNGQGTVNGHGKNKDNANGHGDGRDGGSGILPPTPPLNGGSGQHRP